MRGDWLFADDIIAMLEDMAMDAKNPLFAHNGHVHLYSGPSYDVGDLISGVDLDNHDRAIVRAARLGATLIDDTRGGQFLSEFKGIGGALISGKGLWDYFRENPFVIGKPEENRQAILPWKHASRLLALLANGHVTTTVNGAFRDSGVYYTIEAPYCLNAEHPDPVGLPFRDTAKELFVPRREPIEFINLLPFDRVANGYTPTNWEPAHRLICLGEQRMVLHESLDGLKPPTIRKALTEAAGEVLSRPIEAYQYLLECREAYRVDRHLLLERTGAPNLPPLLPPVERQQTREDRLRNFALLALQLVRTELDMLPPDARPAIPEFTLPGSGLILRA